MRNDLPLPPFIIFRPFINLTVCFELVYVSRVQVNRLLEFNSPRCTVFVPSMVSTDFGTVFLNLRLNFPEGDWFILY